MSSLNIIQNTGSKELYEINKLSGGVGFPTLDAYRWPFKDKEFKKVGYFILEGYENYSDDNQQIKIYFDILEVVPTFDEFVNMINLVVGTNNEFENFVAFNYKFWEDTIKDIMDEIFAELNNPFIDESQYALLKLNKSYIGDNRVILTSENDEYKKEYPEELKWMKSATLDLKTRKLKFQFTHKYEWIEANVDHEKLFAFYVKDDNIITELKRLLPFLKIGD